MIAAKLPSIALLAVTSLLASGCYSPLLSGRYGELAYCQPRSLPAPTPASTPAPALEATVTPAPAPAPPLASVAVPATASSNDGNYACEPGRCTYRPRFPGGLFSFGGRFEFSPFAAHVPSRQAPDYISPQARFHPVPTRPVFEPELSLPPPELIEPAGGNPLRPAAIAHAR